MDRPADAAPPPKPNRTPAAASHTNRSRVSNGRQLFLDGSVDQRSVGARRFRDVLSQLVSDLGGDPSEAQSIVCRRAATLVVWCEQVEAELASGRTFDILAFATATNTLRRLLADLGLERKVLDVEATPLEVEKSTTVKELRRVARKMMLAEAVATRGEASPQPQPAPTVEPPARPSAGPMPLGYELRPGFDGVAVLHHGKKVFHAASRDDAVNFVDQHNGRTS